MTFRYAQFNRTAAPMLFALLLLNISLTAWAADTTDLAATGVNIPAGQTADGAGAPPPPVLAWHRVGSPAPSQDPTIG